ncbi:MAG: hypothetical protein KO254_11035 [Methanoculleus marisnigri]|nr:hypothetical protein [Methanoculleus marisnigri]
MSSYFEKKLIDLLPPLYRERDETGDLETFVKVPASSLDDLKLLADRFPEIFDFDRCEDRFLPLLGEIVGHRFDPLSDAAKQRRSIREAIEIYRRKATIPAIGRSLTDLGWQGRIDETFRKALRLNRRSIVGRAKLPGLIYSLGVYRIDSDNIVQGIRPGLVFHHPAGTKVFFLQWLYSLLSMESDFQAVIKKVVERVCLGHLHETFVVSHNALNTDYHLTRKNKTWGWWRITDGTTLMQDVERAAVCIYRWHGRTPRFRLNVGNLNDERLPNLWVSERRAAFCCEIDTKPSELPVDAFIRLAGQDLNRSRLNRSATACRVIFRQKDLLSEADQPASEITGDRRTHCYSRRSRLDRWLSVGHSHVNGMDKISGAAINRQLIIIAYAGADWSEVGGAWDVVNRWRARRAGFALNSKPLNITELTDAYITEARASFELTVDTGTPRRHRVETLLLNNRRLNHTGLRLSVDRTRPMRLGLMSLNAAGFRISKPSLRWLFRQRDDHAETQAGFEAAANQYTVTQWPVP